MIRGVFAGLTTLDVVHRVSASPTVNQKITAAAQSVGVGGPAASAALTFAALGGDAVLITALGSSPVGRLLRDELAEHGVRVLDVLPDAEQEPPVSVAAVQISSGERSVVSVDAVRTQTPVPAQFLAIAGQAEIVLVDGHYPRLGIAAAKAAAATGIPVVVDAGRWKPAMPELIAVATDMVCSSDFAVPGQDDTMRFLAASGPARVVVTQGGEPVCWQEGDQSGSVTVPQVPVADTLGAGDAFHGAYAFYSAATTFDLPGRIALSIGVATARVESQGPRAWLAATKRWTGR